MNFVNAQLRESMLGKEVADLHAMDIYRTQNKKRVGANAILGVSLAAIHAGATAKGIPLYRQFANLSGNKTCHKTIPVSCFNVINGGEHVGNKLAF